MDTLKKLVNFVISCLLLFGIWETIFGWSQFFGMSVSGHGRYAVTGSFFNPGPFCAYLAVIAPLAFNCIFQRKRRVVILLSYVYLMTSLAIMPLLLGRTGWIAASVGCILVLYLNKIIQLPKPRVAILLVGLTVLICVFLFYMKPHSALGRLFIWKNSFAALMHVPFYGVGWDGVSGAIGKEQELYFEENPESYFVPLADAPEYAFNDFLQIGIAFGALSLLLFVLLVCFMVFCGIKSKHWGVVGSLISFVVVCLGSYPLQFPEFVGTLAVLFALSLISLPCAKVKLVLSFTIFIIFISTFIISSQLDKFRRIEIWRQMRTLYVYQLRDADIHRLDSILGSMKDIPNFLFDYGKALRREKLYAKSTAVLTKGLHCSADPMFLNLIGRNYQDLGDTQMAEYYYKRSINRLPNRLYPYFLLCKLYADSLSYDSGKFEEVYVQSQKMHVKVESSATRQMRSAMDRINDSIKALRE